MSLVKEFKNYSVLLLILLISVLSQQLNQNLIVIIISKFLLLNDLAAYSMVYNLILNTVFLILLFLSGLIQNVTAAWDSDDQLLIGRRINHGLLCGVVISCIAGGLLVGLRDPLLGLYNLNAFDEASDFLLFSGLNIPFIILSNVLISIIQGMKKTFVMLALFIWRNGIDILFHCVFFIGESNKNLNVSACKLYYNF
eukprot:TRINITY_DN7871_c0_g1_i1.p1 TRINITY_DN7871_c0_g1~~TRINITY_DN7871_c0_g1_i1.p1  ORF type:complete len:197 (+),score=48.90 TRINITY_DN7871_c0_g1_i1:59-649(+)